MNNLNSIVSSKYFILLSSISVQNFESLKELSSCKSFNSSPKISQLIHVTAKENPMIKKEELYSFIFPDSAYDDRKIRNLLSRAFSLLQKFIAYNHFIKNEAKYEHIYIDALSEVSDKRFVKTRMSNWKKNNDNRLFFDEELVNQRMQFFDREYRIELKALSSSKRNFSISNKLYNESLDEYFILKKIKLFIESFNYQSIVNAKEEFTLLEEIIGQAKVIKENSLIIKVYYNLLMLQYIPEENKFYYELKKTFSEIERYFLTTQKREVFLLIQNYIIKQINSGNSLFLEELFTLFKRMLENKTIYINKQLSQWSYKNIVTVALRLKEYDWCEFFIENYKNKLDLKHRKEAYSLNKANFYLNNKQFKRALPLLQKINYSDMLSIITAKILQLKIYYELKDFDILISAIDSFDKMMFRNSKIPKTNILRYKNFSKFLKRVIKLKTKVERMKLEKSINEQTKVHSKSWLLEKIKGLY